jgi:membrane-associated protein
MSDMTYKTFITYNVIGGIAWVFFITLLGYILGQRIPNIDHYILYIIGAITLLSAIPAVIEYRKHSRKTV